MSLPVTGWKKLLGAFGYRVNWKEVDRLRMRRHLAKKSRLAEFQFETLEPRQLLANSVTLVNGQLQAVMNDPQLHQLVISTQPVVGENYVTVNGTLTNFHASAVTGIQVTGSPGNDQIDLKSVNQFVFRNLVSGAISVTAGGGDDNIYGSSLSDTITGGLGKDNIYGGFGNDILDGGDGDDSIFAGLGNDSSTGGVGDDRIFGGEGNDSLDGQAGNDTLYGDNGNDLLTGSDGDDAIYGGAGLDQLAGGAGADTLAGGSGDDVLMGDSGNDSLEGETGNDQLAGGSGDDQFVFSGSIGLGNDVISESLNNGTDALNFFGLAFTNGVNVDLSVINTAQLVVGSGVAGVSIQLGGSGQSDGFIENVIGSTRVDHLIGNDFNNRLEGSGGDDFLWPGRGDDELLGGAGNDTLTIGRNLPNEENTSRLDGGEGDDRYIMLDNSGQSLVHNVVLKDPSGTDTLDFSGFVVAGVALDLTATNLLTTSTEINLTNFDGHTQIENVIGTSFNDVLIGNARNNRLQGGGGRDRLTGGDGDDVLLGEAGWDDLEVVDQADLAFTASAGWQTSEHSGGFNQGQRSVEKSADAGLQTATWTFGSLVPGKYEVFVTWAPHPDDVANGQSHGATNAHFDVAADNWTISDSVNQRHAPTGTAVDGVSWTQLARTNPNKGIFTVTGNSLTVSLSNLDANGMVYADAIRIVKYNQAPVISPISTQVAAVGQVLNIPLSATDPDNLASELTFKLAGNAPSGLTLVADGLGAAHLVWPAAGRPDGEISVTVNVTDNGEPARTSNRTFLIQLGGAGSTAPSIQSLANMVGSTTGTTGYNIFVNEGTGLSFNVITVGGNGGLTYSLAPGSPVGATINSAGQFSWTPSEDQSSNKSYPIEIRVTDQGQPRLRATQIVNVTVKEVNQAAVISGPLVLTNLSGVNPVISGTVTNDGSVENVQVVLELTTPLGVSEVLLNVTPTESNSSVGTFRFEPDASYFPKTGEIFADLHVRAKTREVDAAANAVFESLYSSVLDIVITPTNVVPTITFVLQDDVGPVGTPQSTRPRIIGTVTNPNGKVDGLVVRVHLGAPATDAGLINTIRTDENGTFSFVPANLSLSTTMSLWFRVSVDTVAGQKESALTQFNVLYIANQVPSITSIELMHDTGSSNTDGITNDLRVVGQIAHADGPLGGNVVEFDDNNDGTVDGAATTDETGKFVYAPTNAGSGAALFLNARSAEWEEYRQIILTGGWLEGAARLSLQFDPAANTAPGINSLNVLYPILGSTVVDPTVWGVISNDQGSQNVAVEFSTINPTDIEFDRTKDVIGASVPDENGRFEFTPGGLLAGVAYTIYARAVERIPATATGNALLFDNLTIQSTTFTISESPLPTTQFTGIQLAYDTGLNTTDGRTSDPLLHGNVVYGGDYSQLTVEFSFSDSDKIIGTAIPDQNGNFRFTPTGLIDGQSATIRARVRVPDYAYHPVEFDDNSFDEEDYTAGYTTGTGWNNTLLDQWLDDVFNADQTAFEGDWYNSDFQRDWDGQFQDLLTEWQSTTFILDLSKNQSPSVSSVHLVAIAPNSMNPTITGTVINDGNVAGMQVEFWINGRAEADGRAITDGSGQFVYTMQEHTTGSNSVVVRVYEPTYGTDTLTTSNSAPFLISIGANPDLHVVDLQLKIGTLNGNNWQAVDPTLTGTVNVKGYAANLLVRFDYNGDGVVDGETRTDNEGNFEFTPVGLTVDSLTQLTTVRAQVAKEVDGTDGGDSFRTFSPWATKTWEVLPNTAPQITRFELRNDTGHPGLAYQVLDRVTSNPTLVGQVINDNGLVELTVEFDHDGDGIVDGTTLTAEDGTFEYQPKGLQIGGYDIRARVREANPVTGTDLWFDYWPADTVNTQHWASITGTGNPVLTLSNPAPLFYGFTLVAATPANVTSLVHTGNNFDPTLSGTISDPDGSDSTVVEFYLNNPGGANVFLGSTKPKPDGSFKFTPVGLAFGVARVVSALAKKHDYSTGSSLTGSSVAPVTFDFATAGNSAIDINNLNRKVFNDPFDPSVTGHISFDSSGTSPITPIFVEVAVNGVVVDSVPVHTGDTDPGNPQGYYFDYRPELVSGSAAVVIKVRPIGTSDTGYRFGDWVEISFTYDLNLPTIGENVTGSGLGWDLENEYAAAPTIKGEFLAVPVSLGATVSQSPLIEFDRDGDGKVDESVSADKTETTNRYSFSHAFRDLPVGAVEMRVRVTRYETVNLTVPGGTSGMTTARAETIVGQWKTISFALQDPAPEILAESLDLVNEIGNDTIPKAIDATFTGQVASIATDNLMGMTIEVDHDGDGNVDGTTITTGDGSFRYTPVNLSSDVEYGVITLRIRAIDRYTQQEPLVGQWTDFIINFQSIDIPLVTSLALKFNEAATGTPTSDNATIEGTVVGHESAGLLKIEFDHNGDGEVDGTVMADFLGQFTYRPQGLTYGTQTIRARAVAQIGDDAIAGEFAEITDPDYSDSALEFFFTGAQPPVVSETVIANLANGELTGRLTFAGYGTSGRVEIAVMSGTTRIINGTALTDSAGYFRYLPIELLTGTVVLEVRAVLGDPTSTEATMGLWQPVGDFNYAPAALPTTLPGISEFDLAYDTGTSNADQITSDATLVGKVSAVLPGMWVDLSFNGFSSVTASVRVNSDGTFNYRPNVSNLSGVATVDVRTRVWNPATGVYVVNTTTSATNFTFNSTANLPALVTALSLRDFQTPSGPTQVGSIPVFVGMVTNDGAVGGLKVVFDHNGDGIPEGSAITHSDGSFVYRAVGLIAGGPAQSITAWVIERDYVGNALLGTPTQTLNFVLTSAPLVTTLVYDPLAGNDGQIQGTATTGVSMQRHVEYQVFGNNGGTQNIPTTPAGFVPGSLLQTGAVSATGQFVIDLESYGLSVGAAAVLVRAVDDLSATVGPWEILNFQIAPPSYVPQSISNFELVEDTGNSNSDGLTSNSTFSGLVGTNGSGAFALVEFTVTDVTENSAPLVYRATANSDGVFTWTVPQLTVGNEYDVDVRHVVYDPNLQQEVLGSPSAQSFTLLNNNQLATILNFDLLVNAEPVTDPTFIGTVQDDGRIAGIRVEYDTNGDEEADGFTFTDVDGDFRFRLYNVTSNQPTVVRVRVVEWDGINEEYVSPDFADVTPSQSVTFTLEQNGPASPELGGNFNGNNNATEVADNAAVDAVFSHLGHAGYGNGASGTINVGIGTVKLGEHDFSGSLVDSGTPMAPLFTPGVKPTANQSINLQNITIVSLSTLGGGMIGAAGVVPSKYSFIKTVTVSGNTVVTDIYYHIIVASYTASATENGSTSSLLMNSEYTFEFHSSVTYLTKSGLIGTGSFTLSQNLSSHYLRTGSTTDEDGSTSFTAAGSTAWDYDENNSTFGALGVLTQPFTFTAVRHSEYWETSNSETSYGSGGSSSGPNGTVSTGSTTNTSLSSTRSSSSSHSTNTTATNDAGTITVNQGVLSVVGNLSVIATGSANASFTADSSYSTNFGTGNSSSGTIFVSGSSQGAADLQIYSAYESGNSINTVWQLASSDQSTVSLSGSGRSDSSSSTVSSTNSSHETWNFQLTASTDGDGEASGTADIDLSGTTDVVTFTSQFGGEVNSQFGGSASGTVNYSRSDNEESSSSGDGTFSTSFGGSQASTLEVNAHGIDDVLYADVNGSTQSNSTYESLARVTGTAVTPKQEIFFGSMSSSSITSTGNGHFAGSLSPDRTESSGEISFTTTGTVLTASQSFGTFETQDGWVPFRNNSVTTGQFVVNGGLSGTYERRLNDDSNAITYQAAANIDQTLTGSTRNSSYVGIIGELVGYHLEKSTGAVAENISVSATDDNGQTSSSGNFTSSSNGTSDALTTVKGTRTPQLGVTVTMEHFENGGVKFSDASAGVFSEGTEEVTDEFSVGSLNQSVYGNSVSKTNVTSIETNGTALSSFVDTTKFLVNVKGSGAVQSHDDEIISEFGNYSSDRFLKATSDQSLFATMNTTVGNTFTSSILFFGTGTKISLVGGEGATASTVGDTTHSTGGFASETNGSVKMGVTLQATMNTTNGPKIETATLSSTLGGGVVIKDSLGGYFIDSLLVVGISGSESSNSKGQSKISITQTEPGSSSTQSITQSDLSHDGSSYSVNIMQFGEIVGSVLGMFSGSSGGKSETKISSAGNSKSNTGTYWQSRVVTLKSNQNVSLTGTITELGGSQLQPEGSTTGQPSNSGGASASSNGFVLWTASVSDSISGTITNGSFQPISVTIDDIVETGFIRSESTQDLRLNESFSLGSLAEPKSSSSWTINGLSETQTVTVSAVLPPTNGGGGNNPPGGGGGVGTNTGGGVGSSNWRSSHEEISTSESTLSLSESKRGLSNSRSLTDDRTENRIVSHLIWDDNQSDRTSQRVGWGTTLEFTAGQGYYGEPYVSLLKTEFVIEQVETAHEVFEEGAPSYDILGDLQMTDWVNTVTHLVQTRGSGNALRFTDRTRITISTHNEGSVTYLYSGNYSTPEGNGSFIDSTIANKQVTVSESHELLTSGPYGFEPTRVVVTDRTENKTYLKSDVSEFSEGWNSVLESSFMTDRYDTKDVDSNSNSTKTKTTRKDRSPVTNSRSYAYVQEDETRNKTTVNTPDEGEAWTEKDTSEDHRTYVNRVRNNSAKGYEYEHGKAYSSHLWFSSPNGGPPSHDTSYSIRTDWPTGGVTFDDGEENGDDGSYDPTAFQKYDDEISDADLRRQVEDRLGQALSDEYWEIFLSQLRELQRRQMEQDLTIERYGSIGPSEPSFFDRAFDRLTEAEQRNYREELAKETMLTPKGEPLPEIPFAYQNRMARELHMQTLLEMPPGQISWHPDSPLHMNNLTIFLAVPYGRGSGVRPLYIRNSNGRLIPYEAYDTKVRLGIPIELSERQDLTYESKFLNKHLPNTPESLKLIASKKERAAHVFVDEATLRRAEQAIIEDGQFSGSFRYAERYGLYFEEVIGYRIDAAGNKIPLHYAEFKLNPLTGLYHLVPRTGPATPGLGE